MPTATGSAGGITLLIALATAQLLVALDFSIIYVALPSIGTSLNFSAAALQWVVSAYAILFAGLLLMGGQLADRFGGGRVFFSGQLLFAAASVAAAVSPDTTLIIVARAVQGAAAAMLVPATLTLLNAAFAAGPARNRALSVWGTSGALGLVLGLTAGGIIVTYTSWRAVFWTNLPIVALCLASAGPAVLRVRTGTGQRVDPGAAALASTAVITIVLTFTELARTTPSFPVLIAAVPIGIITTVILVITQRRSPQPLIPRTITRVITLRVGCAAAALYMASFGAEFYLVTLDLQDQRHYTGNGVGSALVTTAQYTGGAVGLAILVIVLGHKPDSATYAAGLSLTAALALAGAPICQLSLRRAWQLER